MQCTQEKQEKRAPGRKGGLGAEQQRLLEEYRDVLAQQKQVRAAFEQVTDPELISACVYEMNALQRRYSHLLQKIREENLRCFQVLR
ncbi:MAG: DUF2508 family protein [Clostridia bacterium]|nr:DUF2508 family protein [Clostridia bacterium]MDD7671798.1 DUF2508 family protein [Clostridia bacterium]MDY2929037.1 DUF2508 family protein [Clostridiaceae bacterium]